MTLPKCSYCPNICEGQAFHVLEQRDKSKQTVIRHICDECLIFLFDAVLGQKDANGMNVTLIGGSQTASSVPIRKIAKFKVKAR